MTVHVTKGSVASLEQLATKIRDFVTDATEHTTDVWELIQDEASPYGIIFKAPAHRVGEYQYIQVMMTRIEKGITYSNWYNNSRECKGYRPVNTSTNTYIVEGPNGGPIDIFARNADTLNFSVNKQYSQGLKFYEQGGKITASNTNPKLLQQVKNRYTSSGWQGFELFYPPAYPLLYYPKLTIDDDHPTDWFSYWLIKDRCTLTVVICVLGIWQSISLGLFNEIDVETYAFPAFVAGGNMGFIGAGYQKYNINAHTPTPISGMCADYSIDVVSVSNGNLLSAGKMSDSDVGVTQFAVMRPDGVWTWFGNYKQWYAVIAGYVPQGYVTNYYFPSTPPERINKYNVVYPNNTDIHELVNLYDTTGKDVKMVIPVSMFANDPSSDYKGVIGFVPNNFMLLGKPIRLGEQLIGDSKYLIIPNGWENRLNFYSYYIGVFPLPVGSKETSDSALLKDKMDKIIEKSHMAYLAIYMGE